MVTVTRVSLCVEKQEYLRLYGYEKTVKSEPAHTIRTGLPYFTNSEHHKGKFACWTQKPNSLARYSALSFPHVKLLYELSR